MPVAGDQYSTGNRALQRSLLSGGISFARGWRASGQKISPRFAEWGERGLAGGQPQALAKRDRAQNAARRVIPSRERSSEKCVFFGCRPLRAASTAAGVPCRISLRGRALKSAAVRFLSLDKNNGRGRRARERDGPRGGRVLPMNVCRNHAIVCLRRLADTAARLARPGRVLGSPPSVGANVGQCTGRQ
jgi:hypothetical protein